MFLFLLPTDNQNNHYYWCLEGSNNSAVVADAQDLTAIKQQLANKTFVVALVLPAEHTVTRQIVSKQLKQRDLNQSAPWLLEEQLAQRIEELHCVGAAIDKDNALIVATPKQYIQEHIEQLKHFALNPEYIIAASQLLTANTNEWSCLLDRHYIAINTQNNSYHLANAATFDSMSQLLLQDNKPKQISVYAINPQDIKTHKNLFKKIKISSQFNDTPWLGLIKNTDVAATINLRQGEFSQKINWLKTWYQWRNALTALLSVALLYTLFLVVDNQQLKQANRNIKANINTLQQNLYPQIEFESIAALQDQIEQDIQQFAHVNKDNRQSSQFSEWLSHIGHSLSAIDKTTLRLINYDYKKSTMRFEFSTPDFTDIEKVRNILKQRGIKSIIKNSASQKNAVIVRLECSFDSSLP